MKIVPQLDRSPRLVSFAQTAPGKLLLLAAFACGLAINKAEWWPEIVAALACITFWPARRRLLTSVAALCWMLLHASWINWPFLRELAAESGRMPGWRLTAVVYVMLAAVLALTAVFFRAVSLRRGSFATKRPVLCLMSVYGLLLAAAGFLRPSGTAGLAAWTAIGVTSPLLWYFAYALKDAPARTADGPLLQFGALQPFWGGSNVPYARGAANLRRTEARTPAELSVIQLKAVKLLIWVFVLRMLRNLLLVFVFGDANAQGIRFLARGLHSLPSLGIPELQAAIHQPAELPVAMAWGSLFAHFAQTMLNFSIAGNIVIACCRMAGFRVLRNTWRPLQARTVSDFWNRYYYYFKELLVEFFFFPVFTRYFKGHRRLRMFAATMAAATLGNLVYHFFRDYEFVAQMGLWRALAGFRVYALYATILGLGIWISQLRGQGRETSRDAAPWWRQGLSTAGVLLFFCLLEILDQEGRTEGLGLYCRFFLHLFRIHV